MAFKNSIEEINLKQIYENNERINNHAETKSYYALTLLGLLSVPLFTLFAKMLDLKLFNFWYNITLFVLSLVLLLASLFSLLFSFIPKLTVFRRKIKEDHINKIFEKYENDYYNYRLWVDLKFFKFQKIINYFNNLDLTIIGEVDVLKQTIDIAWIAKKKFNAFDTSIILQMFLIMVMAVLSIVLIFA